MLIITKSLYRWLRRFKLSSSKDLMSLLPSPCTKWNHSHPAITITVMAPRKVLSMNKSIRAITDNIFLRISMKRSLMTFKFLDNPRTVYVLLIVDIFSIHWLGRRRFSCPHPIPSSRGKPDNFRVRPAWIPSMLEEIPACSSPAAGACTTRRTGRSGQTRVDGAKKNNI